jgi:HTH-type transcriptional regulator, sugar sensing transcriptional regulator
MIPRGNIDVYMPTEFGQHKNIASILAKLGLNEIEQKVYLYGIIAPPLPVSALARQVGTTRSNAYNVIDSLESKGLCWNLGAEYGRKIKFAAPEKLSELNKNKIRSLEALENDIKDLGKLLESKKYKGPLTQPRVQYFEGAEGVKKLYSDSLTTKDGMIRTAVYEGIYERFGREYVDNYIQERYKRKIKNKILYAESLAQFNKKYEEDPTRNREVRIPPKSINFDSMIMIYDSRVAIITMSHEIFGTLIDSVDFSNTMKGWFDTVWDISKE